MADEVPTRGTSREGGTRWTYWCPPEGDHLIHPQELQVGIVSVDDDGVGRGLLVAAVIPPIHRDHGWCQAEVFARLACDAMKAQDWSDPDGFVAGLYADGVRVPFPASLPPINRED